MARAVERSTLSANAKTIENLQSAIAMELAAVQQYMLHGLVLEDWGLSKLAEKMRAEMQEELGHAQEYARRIMFLKGTPELTAAKSPQRAQTLQDMFKADLADEEKAINFYTEAARAAGEPGDIGSRLLFERIVLDEEGIGEQGYVAKHMTIDEEMT